MICFGEGNDEFVRSLVAYAHPHTCFLQTTRTHQGDKLEHQVRLLLEELGSSFFHGVFQFLIILARYAIPGFGTAPVMVIDAVWSSVLVLSLDSFESYE